ncbi:MAG: glycosyltransferase family 39 protein [Opitutales bacterium]
MNVTPSSAAPWRRDLLLLLLAFGLLYGFRLGSYPLSNPDEGRYAEIPREMIATGDWVTPRLNGVNYFEKPPLVYWAGAVAQEIFGPAEWVIRAVPVAFALAGVLLTYATARRQYGRRAGWVAATVTGTSLLYFAIGHIPILDMAVTMLIGATLYAFILGVQEPPGARRRWLFYGLYAAAALATLAKGLIGLLLPGAVMFGWLVVFNQWKRLRPFYLPTGALLFLTVAVPWHVLVALHNPTWLHRYFVVEHWDRFFAVGGGHPGAWWYYLPIVLLGLFPWTGFVWPALRETLRGGWARRRANADAWFYVTWAVFIFLFFSKANTKLAPYILPVVPPLAVLIGAGLAPAFALPGAAARWRAGWRGFSFLAGLLAVALATVILRPALVKMDAAQAAELQTTTWVMVAVLLLGGIIVPAVARRHGVRAGLAGIVATVGLFFGALMYAAPHLAKPGTKAVALYVKAHAGPGDRVMIYHEFFHDFTFYAQRPVDVVAFVGELELSEDAAARASGRFPDDAEFRRLWTQPGRIWVVAKNKAVAQLWADPAFHYHLLALSSDYCLFSNQP